MVLLAPRQLLKQTAGCRAEARHGVYSHVRMGANVTLVMGRSQRAALLPTAAGPPPGAATCASEAGSYLRRIDLCITQL